MVWDRVWEPSLPSAPSFGADEDGVGVWIVRVQDAWADLGTPPVGALVPGALVSALLILPMWFHARFSVDNPGAVPVNLINICLAIYYGRLVVSEQGFKIFLLRSCLRETCL
jgi:hypothetical protein